MPKNKLVFTIAIAIALCSVVPALHAQQPETTGTSSSQPTPTSELAQQPATPSPEPMANPADSLPASTRPGHPLDPTDVDTLTGKLDREIEAARTAALPISAGLYGNYGDLYLMQGRFGRTFDIPMLPLARITNPFFFFPLQSRGFGRLGGFRGGR